MGSPAEHHAAYRPERLGRERIDRLVFREPLQAARGILDIAVNRHADLHD